MNKDRQKKIAQAQAMASALQAAGGGNNAHAAMAAMMSSQGGGNSASEVMTSALQGNQMAWSQFSMNPSLYTNDPEAVHKHLGQLVNNKAGGPQGANLISTISRTHPEALVPYTAGLIAYCSDPMMGPILIQALQHVARVDPNNIYPFIPQIIPFSKGQMGVYIISQMIGHAANATVPHDAATHMFLHLCDILKSKPDPAGASGTINEMSNMKEKVPPKILLENLPLIKTYLGSNAIIVTTLEDYIMGRTNAHLSTRIDDMAETIANLNAGCAKSVNFDQVIAYIDANIKDVKDFLGDVAKKLPAPKRLEVVGTLRKTFILHFECCHTGREYPIKSADWSKWLKMGFSLAKAGKMVIDVGTGNPLGLITTGIDCVKGIYEAYKTNDDDEFMSYIKNPFLLSTEQDMLLNKLRDQGFFEKFSYDNQQAGWYLNNPEVDGVLSQGEAGSVSKFRSKPGSTFDSVKSLAEEHMGVEIPVRNPIIQSGSSTTPPHVVTPTTSSASTSSSSVGGRAAAVRSQMAASGSISAGGAGADQTLSLGEQLAGLDKRLADMDLKVSRLEGDNKELRALINSKSSSGGCACVIS